ncbi:hypothetical protein INR49_024973 [Caranx melampygus]|nr:hypothetical protein INR49_024973 [Caranx melampygus]
MMFSLRSTRRQPHEITRLKHLLTITFLTIKEAPEEWRALLSHVPHVCQVLRRGLSSQCDSSFPSMVQGAHGAESSWVNKSESCKSPCEIRGARLAGAVTPSSSSHVREAVSKQRMPTSS